MTDLEPAPMVPEPAREFGPIEAAVGVITRPAAAMREIALARPWLIALALYIVIQLISSLANLTAAVETETAGMPPELQEMMEGFVAASRNPAALLGSAIILSPLLLLVITGILYLVGRMLGGRGPFSALFSTLAYAFVPQLLLAPVAALLNLAGPVFSALNTLLSLGVFIWVLVLAVIGIRESLDLSTGRATATCLIPLAVVVLLFCVLFVLLVFVVVSAIGGAGG